MTPWYAVENIASVPSPTLLLYPDRIEQNLRQMIDWAGDVSRLRPHVKTHKLPQIVQMKLAAGITKFKASTIAECEMTAAAGGQDILLAYQPVGPNIDRLCELIRCYPNTRFSTIVDDQENLAALSGAAKAAQVSIPVFIDLDVGMHRTGIAPGPAALNLYLQICNSPAITAAGVHAYDGHLHHQDENELRRMNDEAFRPVWELITAIENQGADVPTIVAGGTPTSGMLARHAKFEVGAGTAVLWDSGQGQLAPNDRFQSAAILVSRVISKPGDQRLCLDLGHKAVASEMPHPRVALLGLEDATPVVHSEEHLVVQTSRAGEYSVGSVVYGIPRHICPTVALQSDVWIVRDGVATETWPVIARTRKITI